MGTYGKLSFNLKVLIEGEEDAGCANLEVTLDSRIEFWPATPVISSYGAAYSPEKPSLTVATGSLDHRG
jgi:hypothetical protein